MSEERQNEPALGTLIGPYRLLRRVGEGGMAIVWEAEHTGLKKRVALKLLVRRLANDPKIVQRFRREGEAMARIRHQHVVDVSDVGDFSGLPFLVMEFLKGENLGSLIKRESPLPVAQTVDLLLPVIAAVCAAHRESVVHRDLKPDNLFLARSLDEALIPKVVDFGISKMAGAADLTGTQEMMGTPFYMSPEQIQDPKRVDARSDQFALGAILYECLTGRRPFDGELALQVMFKIVNGKFEPPRRLRPDIPVMIEGIILRAMALRADERFPATQDLGRELLPFASADIWARFAGEFGAGTTTQPPPRTRQHLWAWSSVGLMLCTVSASYFLLRSSQTPSKLSTPPIAAAQSIDSEPLTTSPGELQSKEHQAKTTSTPTRTGFEPYESGERNFVAGHYWQAARDFEEAFVRSRKSDLLFNAGRAYDRGDYRVWAIDAYQQYLNSAPESEDKAQVQRRITELRANLAKIFVVTSEAGFLFIDGHEYGSTPMQQPMDIDSGYHRIEVRHGAQTWSTKQQFSSGQSYRFEKSEKDQDGQEHRLGMQATEGPMRGNTGRLILLPIIKPARKPI